MTYLDSNLCIINVSKFTFIPNDSWICGFTRHRMFFFEDLDNVNLFECLRINFFAINAPSVPFFLLINVILMRINFLTFVVCNRMNFFHPSTDLKVSDNEAHEILKVASHSSGLERSEGSHLIVNGIYSLLVIFVLSFT